MGTGWSWTPVFQIAAGFILGALVVGMFARR
jgi:hypothetical protein